MKCERCGKPAKWQWKVPAPGFKPIKLCNDCVAGLSAEARAKEIEPLTQEAGR